MLKHCEICGTEFHTKKKGHSKIYCSKQCQKSGHTRKRHQSWKHCPNCGVPKAPHAKHCKKCFGLFMRGENNSGWKGGRTSREGYILVRTGSSDRNRRYEREHRVIWERTHNKPIPRGWLIHHINGIKYDNRPANLVALPSLKHSLLIPIMKKRIQELEAKLNNQNQLL